MIQNLINHVSLVVDKSASMAGQPVIDVFDRELEHLKQRSVDLSQETRISIYMFNESVECLAFDMDVMRFKTLRDHWRTSGYTALIDAVWKSIDDNQKLPELYGDHAFLQYVITDGEENRSRHTAAPLANRLSSLADNWTVACLVPNPQGVMEAKKFGFNKDSIAIWDTSSRTGFEKMGKQFSSAMNNYMTMRASGVRSTRGLFTLDTSGVSITALTALSPRLYDILPVRKDSPIRDFVEGWTDGPYVLGSAYYEPTKAVVIQDHKNILVQSRKDGKVYEGSNLRHLLGLPDQTVTVNPGAHADWRIFIQSTSVNRKVFKDTFVLVRK